MTAHDYVKTYLNTPDLDVKQLAGDASTRKYYRILDNSKNSYILMDYSNEISSGRDFLEVQSLLDTNQINCPKVIDHNSENKFILLEDLSDHSLEEAFKNNQYIKYYEQTVKLLAKLHNTAPPSDSVIKNRSFDYEKLIWECEFGIKHLNTLFEIDSSLALNDLSNICKQLDSLPRVICHRDFHSRNIMINSAQAFFIDFQDARMGPWQYDIVSLLHDSYVNLNKDEIKKLLDLYLEEISFEPDHDWMQAYNLQLIQRTFKACGSFASLKNLKDTDRYLEYLPKCLNLLLSITNDFPDLHRYINTLNSSPKGIII